MFTWHRLTFVASAIVAYMGIATLGNFYAMGLPHSPVGALYQRSIEASLLWMLLWSGVGCYAGMRGRWSEYWLGVAVITLVPLLLVLPTGAIVWWDVAAWLLEDSLFPSPFWIKGLMVFMGLGPLIFGACCAGLLRLQLQYWERALRKGVCQKCSYNLTGNVSGICPECGTPVGPRPEVQRTTGDRNALDVRWLYVMGILLFICGYWLFRTASHRWMAYSLLGGGGMFIVAFAILRRKLVRRNKRG